MEKIIYRFHRPLANTVTKSTNLCTIPTYYRHTTLFEPALPEEKVAAINNIEMGIIGKVILAFDKMWLPADTTVVPFFWKAEDLAKVPADEEWVTHIGSASRSMGADNVWVLWTSGNTTKHVSYSQYLEWRIFNNLFKQLEV